VTNLESLRGPLTGYCYRILASASEVEDAVQETMLRALRAIDSYDPDRAAFSTWVHRIATNVCLDMLRGARRRALPWDMGPAASGPDLGVPLPPTRWVEPFADSRLADTADPATLAVRHETLRLAFIAALQWLPPRQRAVLVLRDVLGFAATEAAEVTAMSVPAVNSALQRARATLAEHRPDPADPPDPGDPTQRELLQRYVHAFEVCDRPSSHVRGRLTRWSAASRGRQRTSVNEHERNHECHRPVHLQSVGARPRRRLGDRSRDSSSGGASLLCRQDMRGQDLRAAVGTRLPR
jgi:RNA polymerase sigma-70 factor (ECF subfamily)